MEEEQFKHNVVHHRVPFHTLPRDIILEVLSKMEYKSFIYARLSTKWLHSFIEKSRDQIKVIYPRISLSISHQGVDRLRMPLRELTALRPREVFLSDLKFKKIPRVVKMLYKLGWLSQCKIVLYSLGEKTTMRFMDEIYYNQYFCAHLQLTGNGFVTSNNVSLHPLLAVVPHVNLGPCPCADLDFILGIQSTIRIVSRELQQSTIINRLIHSVSNGTSSVESFYIQYNHYQHDPINDILAQIPYKLLWSHSTNEHSVFAHRRLHPLIARFRASLFLIAPMNNGKVMGIQTFYYEERSKGAFKFMLYNSEEEFIVALETATFRPQCG